MKKFFSVLLAFVLTMALFSPSIASAEELENEGNPNDAQTAPAFAEEPAGSFVPAEIGFLDPIIVTPFSNYSLGLGETHSWDVTLLNKSPYPNVDIMYVVDTTGSMASIRGTVADTLAQFTEDLAAADAESIHIGTAFFGDASVDSPWHDITLPLGEYTQDEVIEKIYALNVTGGGDSDEDAVWALMNVINETEWRPDAQHVIILVTDVNTKTHPEETVGGFPVTLEGLRAIVEANNIHSPMIMNYRAATGDIAGALDVTAFPWVTGEELLTQLESILISTDTNVLERDIDIRTNITYLSDGAPSSDITLTVSETDFILAIDENKPVHFSAAAAAAPSRFDDDVKAVIEFYVDGVLVSTATQVIQLDIPDAVVIYVQPTERYTPFMGGILQVPVNIASNPGLGSFAITIKVPSDIMPYVHNIDIEYGAVSSEFMTITNPAYGEDTLLITGASFTETDLDGTIAYLNLDIDPAIANGSFPIELGIIDLGKIVEGVVLPITYFTVRDGSIDTLSAQLGNVDGLPGITVMDSMLVMAYLAGTAPLSTAQQVAADVDINGVIDVMDAQIIQLSAAGISPLPNDTLTFLKINAASEAVPAAAEVSVYDINILEPLKVVPYSSNTVSVPVSIQNNAGVASFDLSVKYDSSSLKPIGYTMGDVWAGSTIVNLAAGEDLIKVIGVDTINADADGSIINVLFETLDSSNAAASLELEVLGLIQVGEGSVKTLDGFSTNGTEIIFE